MDFTEIFNTVWGWVIATVGGVSVASIISGILWVTLKASFNKTIQKANLEKTQAEAAEMAAAKAIEKIKALSFKQSLQPVVESQLKKITEETQVLVREELEEVKDRYNKLLLVLEALSKYFDNSIGVSDDAKQALKDAIEDAKNESIEEYVEEEVVVEEAKEEPKTDTKKTSNTSVDR